MYALNPSIGSSGYAMTQPQYGVMPQQYAVPFNVSPYAPFAGAIQSVAPQSAGGLLLNLRASNSIMSGNNIAGYGPSTVNAQIPGDFLFNTNYFGGQLNLNGNIGGNANISNNLINQWAQQQMTAYRPSYSIPVYRPQPRPMPLPVAYAAASVQQPVSQAVAFAGQYSNAVGQAGVQYR